MLEDPATIHGSQMGAPWPAIPCPAIRWRSSTGLEASALPCCVVNCSPWQSMSASSALCTARLSSGLPVYSYNISSRAAMHLSLLSSSSINHMVASASTSTLVCSQAGKKGAEPLGPCSWLSGKGHATVLCPACDTAIHAGLKPTVSWHDHSMGA